MILLGVLHCNAIEDPSHLKYARCYNPFFLSLTPYAVLVPSDILGTRIAGRYTSLPVYWT